VNGWNEGLEVLRSREFHVVCLPDFFLDHFVRLPAFADATASMLAIHDRGGGNLPGIRQSLASGGNAANTANALAYLGVRAHLVARTSPFGLSFLRETLGRAGVDLTHVRSDGELAITTALEYGHDPRNVMLSDPGSVATFAPEDLDDNARTLIEAADAVLVANWTLARGHGTELAETVLREARRGHALTYFDTGDPSGRSEADRKEVLSRVVRSPDLDVFALNENELRYFGGDGDLHESAARLAKSVTATVDVHTAAFAATWGRQGLATAPTFRVSPVRATGAGDTWNAANLVAHLVHMPPEMRLGFANAAAGLYVSSATGAPPTVPDIVRFLETAHHPSVERARLS
jgi:sugar/nucleoside kinase (ribokinase family)